MNTRVKIPRLLLIEKVQEEIDKENAAHAKAVSEYEEKVLALLPLLQNAVSAFREELDGKKPEEVMALFSARVQNTTWRGDEGIYIRFPEFNLPAAPVKSNTDYLEKVKRVLEASTDEVISVSSRDDYYRFL